MALPLVALVGCGGSPSASPPGTSGAGRSGAIAGIDELELLAPPMEGAGDAPKFEWKAVDGAASYRLFVLDADGKPLWAWQGTATSVWLGGLPEQLPEGEAGPRVTQGSTWTVAALDADEHVLAVSAPRSVAP